jgi:hypothetical protein
MILTLIRGFQQSLDYRNFMTHVNQSLAAKALVGDYDMTLSEEDLDTYLDQFGLFEPELF